MKAKKVEALYYQFTLQKGFIPKNIVAENIDKTMAIRYATRKLCSFINDNLTVKKKIV